MSAAAESQRLRIADAARRDADTRRAPPAPPGAPTVLAITKTIGSYPTTAAAFYGCQTATVVGTEAEGSPGAASGLGDTFYALNVGTAVPPTGTQVVCTYVDYRWVFRYDG